jgi:hypothetical protein
VFSPPCGGDDLIENSLRYLLFLLLGSKAVGRILAMAHFWKYQLEINGNYNSRYKCVQVLRVNFV